MVVAIGILAVSLIVLGIVSYKQNQIIKKDKPKDYAAIIRDSPYKDPPARSTE